METNKVSVKIYGQEYVISGDQGREQIVKVGAYVDGKMHDVVSMNPACSTSDLAVLAAVNIADEYFEIKDIVDDLRKMNVQLEKDAQHYVQLWDESKKSYAQYKDETQYVNHQKDDLMRQINDKDRQLREMKEQQRAVEEEVRKGAQSAISKSEERCKELENSFFDLQMENLQLKKMVDSYRQEPAEK